MAHDWTSIEVGLVLQGGGALGAYEWGAIEALFGLMDELEPTMPITLRIVTGVSIGAINGACIVGAKGKNEVERRKAGRDQLECCGTISSLKRRFMVITRCHSAGRAFRLRATCRCWACPASTHRAPMSGIFRAGPASTTRAR
jgi:predicted acylesterase/phospholipase RssA